MTGARASCSPGRPPGEPLERRERGRVAGAQAQRLAQAAGGLACAAVGGQDEPEVEPDLGEIRARAKSEAERMLGVPVDLRLHVRVTPGWTESPDGLRKMGYE